MRDVNNSSCDWRCCVCLCACVYMLNVNVSTCLGGGNAPEIYFCYGCWDQLQIAVSAFSSAFHGLNFRAHSARFFHSQVSFQCICTSKGLLAGNTCIGLVPRMNPNMSLQIVFSRESPRTDVAKIWTQITHLTIIILAQLLAALVVGWTGAVGGGRRLWSGRWIRRIVHDLVRGYRFRWMLECLLASNVAVSTSQGRLLVCQRTAHEAAVGWEGRRSDGRRGRRVWESVFAWRRGCRCQIVAQNRKFIVIVVIQTTSAIVLVVVRRFAASLQSIFWCSIGKICLRRLRHFRMIVQRFLLGITCWQRHIIECWDSGVLVNDGVLLFARIHIAWVVQSTHLQLEDNKVIVIVVVVEVVRKYNKSVDDVPFCIFDEKGRGKVVSMEKARTLFKVD